MCKIAELPWSGIRFHASCAILPARAASGTIGIEVTELCLERPRAEAGRIAKVAGKTQERYRQSPNSQQVDVGAAFRLNVEHVGSLQLVSGLVDFVLAHQN